MPGATHHACQCRRQTVNIAFLSAAHGYLVAVFPLWLSSTPPGIMDTVCMALYVESGSQPILPTERGGSI